MKIAEKILTFFTLKIERKTARDSADRLVQLSIVTIPFLLYLVVFCTLLLFRHQVASGIIAGVAAISILLIIVLAYSKKRVNSFGLVALAISGIALLAILIVGKLDAALMIGVAMFPMLALSTTTPNRAHIISFIFWILYSCILITGPKFIGESVSSTGYYRLLSIIFYPLLQLVASLLYLFKAKRLQELEKQLIEQKNQNKLREDYLAKLSHQLRTPLNNIMVISNMLSNTITEDKYRDLIDTIQASTNSLAGVVNGMVEKSSTGIEPETDFAIPFNLSDTINNTIRLFATQSQTVNFNIKIDESIPKTLKGDPVKLKQIFLNIIENVIKNKEGSKVNIEIIASRMDNAKNSLELFFEVKSNVPLLIHQNEGYSQTVIADSTSSSLNNQFFIDLLDLTITNNLVQSNGGKLNIKLTSNDAVVSFTYFLNSLPEIKKVAEPEVLKTTQRQHDEISTLTAQPSAEAKGDGKLSNANVLLVEDNLINQKIVILSLKKLVKNIDVAANGKEALDKFGTSQYDIILMDVQMPIMNGYVATRKIREIEASTNSHTPIIAITANALLGDREESLAAGMDDYISKPFQIEVLIQKMKKFLE